jgi:hypothetical protein
MSSFPGTDAAATEKEHNSIITPEENVKIALRYAHFVKMHMHAKRETGIK